MRERDGGGPPKRVLIVDDDEEFVRDLLRVWKAPGVVLWAGTGMDAVRAIIRSRPEVVLLDLNLPRYLADTEDEEGFRVLDFAREVLGPDALVVLMTRDDSGEIRDAARTRGADALLAKPLKIAELERILRARRSSRAWRRCGAEGSAQATGCRPGKDGRRRNHVHENEDE